MQSLNLPSFDFRLKKENDKVFIFDVLRKKFILLTPEEWVRQHFIMYLHHHKGYPLGLMSVEKGLNITRMKKRYDLVCYHTSGKPLLIVECKAPGIKISNETFLQAAHYNSSLKLNFLAVTNGNDHYICSIDHEKGGFSFLEEIPPFTSFS